MAARTDNPTKEIEMEISEYTLQMAEKHRTAKATYYGIDAETAPEGALEAAKREYETTARYLAWSVLDDIDRAGKVML